MALIALLILGWIIYKITKTTNSSNSSMPPVKKELIQNEKYSKSKTKPLKAVWNIDNVEVSNFKILDALIYTKNSAYDNEFSSTVTLHSGVGAPNSNIPKLDYWPSYQNLTNGQRAKYLEWLASGRKSNLEEVGYIFLFFYGLERRFFIDKKDKEIILDEVQRLLLKYGELSGSLRSYLGDFLIYNHLEKGINNITSETINSLEKIISEKRFLPIKLAYLYQNKLSLDGKTAFSISKSLDISNNKSVIVKRTEKLIEKLFKQKYEQKYGESFILKLSKRKETFNYRTATNDFYIDNTLEYPSILGISSQFKKLGLLYNECVEDLRKVSSLIAKGISEDDPRYFSALPELLKSSKQHPLKNKFIEITNESEKKGIYNFIKVSNLATLIGLEPREKLTLTQSKSIVELCKGLEYKVEPDSFITTKPYLWTSEIAIFKSPNYEEKFINYNLCKLILEIGVVIANSDGVIDQEEIDHITTFIEVTFASSEDETLRIEALKHIYTNNPPSINGLGKKLKENLNKSQIEIVSEFIVSLSTINGELHKKEERTLKTLFKAMGVEMSELEALLQKFKERYEEPVEVLVGTTVKGEAIQKEVIEPVIKLDKDIIENTLANTKEIASLLGDIFDEDDDNEKIKKTVKKDELSIKQKVEPTPKNHNEIEGLDANYKVIFNKIITKSEWSKVEFEALAREHKFMPSAIVEVINEWSDEALEDFLIEENGSSIIIDLELLEGV